MFLFLKVFLVLVQGTSLIQRLMSVAYTYDNLAPRYAFYVFYMYVYAVIKLHFCSGLGGTHLWIFWRQNQVDPYVLVYILSFMSQEREKQKLKIFHLGAGDMAKWLKYLHTYVWEHELNYKYPYECQVLCCILIALELNERDRRIPRTQPVYLT